MKKYEVKTVSVETKDGKDAINVFLNQTNQDTYLLKSFDNLEDARAFYATVDSSVRYMGRYYLHECKMIEENEYDEDGEWINGGEWWESDFPEYQNEKEDK